MIDIQEISKNFGGQTLFEGLSLKLSRGEKLGIVGRNGSGKSTLLKLITGQEHPTQGNISIPRHYDIGYVSQYISFSMPSLLEECCLGLKEEQKFETYRAEKILMGLGFSEKEFSKKP